MDKGFKNNVLKKVYKKISLHLKFFLTFLINQFNSFIYVCVTYSVCHLFYVLARLLDWPIVADPRIFFPTCFG